MYKTCACNAIQSNWTRDDRYDIAAGISSGLANTTVVAKVNGDLWDLDRPLEEDTEIELLKFDDKEARSVFHHSSAHILGSSLEKLYGCHLCTLRVFGSGSDFIPWETSAYCSYPFFNATLARFCADGSFTRSDLMGCYGIYESKVPVRQSSKVSTTICTSESEP